MNRFLAFFIFITLSLASFADGEALDQKAATKKDVLRLPGRQGTLSSNRLAYIETSEPKNNNLPILLLGPGVNRGVMSFDRLLGALKKRGYGLVALHFSTLPHSVAALNAEDKPFFEEEDFSMQDYADEMEAVGLWAQNKFKREVIPVTLSFSGAPSSLLKTFKKVIDLAPMTSLKHAKPTLFYFYNNLKLANMFNPFGPSIIRAAMDQSYLSVWRSKTEEMIQGFGFNPELEDSILEGYMTSSRALEDFEWKVEETPQQTLRAFVLAEEESESLLKGQVEILKEFFKQNKQVACFFIRGAQHAVSFSHPVTTAIIIDQVARSGSFQKKGCFDVQEKDDFRFIEENQLDGLFPVM